jgi:hypothetical protein
VKNIDDIDTKMNLKEAYFYILDILDDIYWNRPQKQWNKDQYDRLASLLGDMSAGEVYPVSDILGTGDPATWDDWLEAVKKVVGETNKNINAKEAKMAAIELMKEYNSQGVQLNDTIEYMYKHQEN